MFSPLQGEEREKEMKIQFPVAVKLSRVRKYLLPASPLPFLQASTKNTRKIDEKSSLRYLRASAG